MTPIRRIPFGLCVPTNRCDYNTSPIFFGGRGKGVSLRCSALDPSVLIVSTGSIRWILWFSVRYAAAAARREIFGVNALRGKQQQPGSPNLQDIFIGGVSFSGKENSLILKNKMAAMGISLKIIYIFLLAVPHR